MEDKKRWQEVTVDEAVKLLKKEVCICGQFSDDGEKWHFDETSLIQPGSEHPFVRKTPTGRLTCYKRFRVGETWHTVHGWGRWGK